MWITPITLVGRVVRLEPCTVAHAAGMFDIAMESGAETFRFTLPPTNEPIGQWSAAGVAADIERINALSYVVAFAVIHLPSNRIIGRTTYMEIRPPHRGVEIGRTWIARAHQGTAVNPEMKYLMMRHAFETKGAIRVQFKTGLNNLHSQAAIAKLGAVREGVLRNQMILPDGTKRDTVVFSVTDAEWPMVKSRLEQRLGYLP
jgi:RimJ/RimL family protein N-acetyltransferase